MRDDTGGMAANRGLAARPSALQAPPRPRAHLALWPAPPPRAAPPPARRPVPACQPPLPPAHRVEVVQPTLDFLPDCRGTATPRCCSSSSTVRRTRKSVSSSMAAAAAACARGRAPAPLGTYRDENGKREREREKKRKNTSARGRERRGGGGERQRGWTQQRPARTARALAGVTAPGPAHKKYLFFVRSTFFFL